jgi:lipoate synthase
MDLIYDRLKLSNQPVQYTLQALKKKKRKERKLEALLEKHGIHGVCTSSKCPRRHLSVFAPSSKQCGWFMHHI